MTSEEEKDYFKVFAEKLKKFKSFMSTQEMYNKF